MLESYQQRRERLLEGLYKLTEATVSAGDERCRKALLGLAARVRENRFTLAVLGQYKRGKSTFINALLGDPLLPSAVVPLTSVGTILAYGPDPEARVLFQSGATQSVGLDSIAEFVTEKGNPNNGKGVEALRVTYPALLLQKGVVLVDTPGVGSTYRHNTEAAATLVGQCDAAVFLLGVDPPVGEVELEFLRFVRDQLSRIFFVLNKTDVMTHQEVEESLAFSAEVISGATGACPPVFPLSAREALQAKLDGDHDRLAASGLLAFEAALGEFLAKEKGEALIDSVRAAAGRLAGNLRTALEFERRAWQLPIEELREKEQALRARLAEAENERRDVLFLLKAEMADRLRTVDEELEGFKREEVERLAARLDQLLDESPQARAPELLAKADTFLTEGLQRDFRSFGAQAEQKARDAFGNAVSRVARRLIALADQVRREAAGLFDLRPGTLEWDERFERPGGWHLVIGDPPPFLPTPDETTLFPLLPRALVRRRIKRRYQDRIEQEVDRNCGRLRTNLLEGLEKSFGAARKTLAEEFDDAVSAITRGIVRALAESSPGESAGAAKLKALAGIEAELDAARASLAGTVAVD